MKYFSFAKWIHTIFLFLFPLLCFSNIRILDWMFSPFRFVASWDSSTTLQMCKQSCRNPGGGAPPEILLNQLTLFPNRGQIVPIAHIPPSFSDLPTALAKRDHRCRELTGRMDCQRKCRFSIFCQSFTGPQEPWGAGGTIPPPPDCDRYVNHIHIISQPGRWQILPTIFLLAPPPPRIFRPSYRPEQRDIK